MVYSNEDTQRKKEIPIQVYDFVALDFEAATGSYNSACAIGIAAVREGRVVKTFYSLLAPPGLKFDWGTIKVHGIKPSMVRDKPTLDQVWGEISEFFGDALVIAHNPHFDMMVLRESLSAYQPPEFEYADSQRIAQSFVGGSRSLKYCAEFLGIDMGHHHNAGDDALTCARVVLACMERASVKTVRALCEQEQVPLYQTQELAERMEKAAAAKKQRKGGGRGPAPQKTGKRSGKPSNAPKQGGAGEKSAAVQKQTKRIRRRGPRKRPAKAG